MTETDVLRLLGKLELCYDEPHDLEREARWVKALADASGDAIFAAAETYMAREPRWFPKPAQLLTMTPSRLGSHHAAPKPRVQRDLGGDPPPFKGHIVRDGPGLWFLPEGAPLPFKSR